MSDVSSVLDGNLKSFRKSVNEIFLRKLEIDQKLPEHGF